MIKIKLINWLSREAKEAEVLLSDGKFNITCFSHPFNYQSTKIITQPLYSLNASDMIVVNSEQKLSVEKTNESFGYKITGYVFNKKENQVKIGEFIIELDNQIPLDINEGNYLSFICDRIDIY